MSIGEVAVLGGFLAKATWPETMRTTLASHTFGPTAREAWRQHKAWGVSPRTVAFEFLAREAGGSLLKWDIVDEN
jgi:hypothetical protein